MSRWLYLFVWTCLTLAPAQSLVDTFLVSRSASGTLAQPYLTRDWYDGYINNFYNKTGGDVLSPLWLTYIEQGSTQTVLAHNIAVSYDSKIKITNSQIIANTEPGNRLSTPIIENFRGRPVAIWQEESTQEIALYSSVYKDSAWSEAVRISGLGRLGCPVRFFTRDDFNLERQTSGENILVWADSTAILQAKLDTLYNWGAAQAIAYSEYYVSALDVRPSLDKSLWVLWEEQVSSDSIYIHLIIREAETEKWSNPMSVLSVPAMAAQSALNMSYDYDMILSWVAQNTFHDTLLTFLPDSLVLEEFSAYLPPPQQDIRIVSNTLQLGGCVLAPETYYFTTWRKDSLRHLEVKEHKPWFSTAGSMLSSSIINGLSISGLYNSHFVTAWTETDSNDKSKIYVGIYYISMGAVEKQPVPIKSTPQLLPNWPNPFNPQTTISCSIPVPQQVELRLFDSAGRHMGGIFKGRLAAGLRRFNLDGTNLPSGMYYVVLKSQAGIQARKCLLLK